MSYSDGTNINYAGHIKLTTYLDNKVLSVKHYKNKGTLSLFRFLGNCLVGNFNTAGRLRPLKIKLLADNGEANVPPTKETVYTEKSSFITVATAPDLITTNSTINNASCSVVFNFIFPIANVYSSGANTIALYGINATEAEDFSAYYRLTKPDPENPEQLIWDAIELKPEDFEENKVFAVEWTLTLSNK